MTRPINELLPGRPEARLRIYAWSTPDIPKYAGCLKVGQTTQDVNVRIKQSHGQAKLKYTLEVDEPADRSDGAYFRVHHFARQLGSPFPLLAAVGARTSRIEIGTAVIDMRYENPLYMAEDAGAADLIAGGRLQLGISRGSPEQVIDGWRYFGYEPAEGERCQEPTIGAKGGGELSVLVAELRERRSVPSEISVARGLGLGRCVARALPEIRGERIDSIAAVISASPIVRARLPASALRVACV